MDMHEHDEDELTARDRAFGAEFRQAMERVNAPGSLEVFLMNAAEAEAARQASGEAIHKHGRILAFPRPRAWFGGAIAAVLAIACFSVEGVHIHREHERAQATRQFDEAQEITDRTLEQTRQQLERKGFHLDQ